MTLLEQIRCFEEQFHCHLAFHDFSGELTSLAGGKESFPLHHANDRCEAVRSRNSRSYYRCVADDTKSAREMPGCGIVKHCHAGYYEFVFPILKYASPAGTMFVGVFSHAEELTPKLRFFAELFAHELERRLEMVPETAHSGSVRDRMEVWFLHRFRNPDISRGELAEYLHLSPSRVSQLMRTYFGKTFPEYVLALRLETARKILENSGLSVTEAARLAGFRSANYLHRAFRRASGVTPGSCRGKSSAGEETTDVSTPST